MTGSIRYRLPDGVEIVSEDGNAIIGNVTVPSDDAGHIGRRCPTCTHMFRMHAEDYSALPEDLILTCPYCCARADHTEFITEQQQARALAGLTEVGRQYVMETAATMFSDLAQKFNTPHSSIRIQPSHAHLEAPEPLPPIVEEEPIRQRRCARCANRYAVFGAHVACPVCGPLPPRVIADDALDARAALLSALARVPNPVLAQLREIGAIDHTAEQTLGSVVSTLEPFLKQTFLDRVPGGEAIVAREHGAVFQRIDDAARLYRDHLAIDIRSGMTPNEWDQLCQLYGIRHLITHTSGIVDQRHLNRFPGRGFVLGRRVQVTLAQAEEAIGLARTVIAAIP